MSDSRGLLVPLLGPIIEGCLGGTVAHTVAILALIMARIIYGHGDHARLYSGHFHPSHAGQ